MPDINSLLEKSEKKKFKKSSYRPWNYMEEIQKEEKHQQDTTISDIKENITDIQAEKTILPIIDEPKKTIENKKTEIVHINEIHKNTHFIPNQKDVPEGILYKILRLSGHQKIIFNFILDKCITRGLLSTGTITSEILINITHTSLTMVNTSIQRLVEKKIIRRENGKRGRGGFYCFSMSQEVRNAAVEYRRITNFDNVETPKVTENPLSKIELSQLDSKKITSGLPLEWEEIDIEPLAQIGFTKGHLLQLFKQNDLDVTSVQDSIYYFEFDLKYNNKAASITKSSPLGYFMGILKRVGLYNAPENYESPKNRALRTMLEHKKIEKEKRDSMIKELINLAFDDWQTKLSQDEKDNLLPIEIRKSKLISAKQASLKLYFTEHVWPTIMPKEIVN